MANPRAKADPAASDAAPRFTAFLERQHATAGPRTKGERTRDRLKLAAAEILSESGWNELRLADVAKRAGIAPATFYLYYQNRVEVTVAVVNEFADFLHEEMRRHQNEATLFASILRTNTGWIRVARENAGLLSCLMQINDGEADFAEISHRVNYGWYSKVARNLVERYGVKLDVAKATLLVYALGGMMDEFARRYVIARDPHLNAAVEAVASSDAELAHFLSVAWHRTLTGRDPEGVAAY